MRVITADERMAETRAPKVLIAGPPKIGKTSLLRTAPADRTLFVDLEAGDLAVQDVQVDQVRPRTWIECRDLACFLAGPNPALPPEASYSQAHYEHVVSQQGDAGQLDKYDLYFIDSLTVAARLCMTWCEQQPGAVASTGNKDTRAIYGMLGREMLAWLTQLQHATTKAVVFVCILEAVKDDFNRVTWELQIDGQKIGRELPGIVDEVITMQLIKPDEDQPEERWFVCKQNNPMKYPAGDRSGRLDMLEPPHLGKLLNKLTARITAKPPVQDKQAA